ncbi:30S ribosomal protein S20 [Clostridium tyrobutyricum]|jgi:small subunit ribosomal protein S20|uniref:Small ribosomal subunit protein bS20 n=1 Tax=Clostridium tyrobutyricum DIVETGP TaxID=1408889 RepID=W6N875_CLOTY|nr:30S ribosomal protein S20 [Clostridium tyrobutyricum]AND85678.1 30S ribosomal protein S20 [Clostridium tyrobutyricum]ANP70199.1 30S ribosomal protein S20 [Clostridium tyrobutyricum]MBR9647875.1 30S ribosomal protein S20 [Clostridium tyrobutyricum]MBV4415031.1 30S ribosomal protein S20 [Clostridium tyrobutyricum]MBV4421143.1 30S ribosomal protein S20 [Clostridium tyrobutyricum]
MANIKSAKKRIKVIETKTLRNKIIRSSLKTTIKKFLTAVENNNAEEAKIAYLASARSLDKAVSKGIIHKNKAARKKSRLAARLDNLSA